jgi:hypothetical protein
MTPRQTQNLFIERAVILLLLMGMVTFASNLQSLKKRVTALESHNATPAQHETANLAEKHNETDN